MQHLLKSIKSLDTLSHFEVWSEHHLTVQNCTVQSFTNICESLDVKPILIDLQIKSETPTQLMTTSTYKGNLFQIWEENERIYQGLISNGLEVSRRKIEIAPFHPIVPADHPCTDPMYFEAHIKVSTHKDRLQELRRVSKEYFAHTSRNAFKCEQDDCIYMVTFRLYRTSLNQFKNMLSILIQVLEGYKFDIVEQPDVEFAIYDTNSELDKEWLTNV